jgi:hypothetical protein
MFATPSSARARATPPLCVGRHRPSPLLKPHRSSSTSEGQASGRWSLKRRQQIQIPRWPSTWCGGRGGAGHHVLATGVGQHKHHRGVIVVVCRVQRPMFHFFCSLDGTKVAGHEARNDARGDLIIHRGVRPWQYEQ